MSLKNAEPALIANGANGFGFSRWPITRQLAWFYALSTTILLILACGVLYGVLVTTLQREDENALRSRAHVLRAALLTQPDDALALSREVAEDNGGSGTQENLYSRILDESGHTLFSSADMQEAIPLGAFAGLSLPSEVRKWQSASGTSFLLLADTVKYRTVARPERRVQIGLNTTNEEMLLNRYLRYLLGVLAVGVLLSSAIGVAVARQGLRPLRHITQAAERITASHLHARIQAGQWPQELGALAKAFDSMLDRLEDAFERLSQFSADLAHELRTPINNLRGEAEVALSQPRSVLDYREILASSLEEYGRLSRIMDGLLFLAKAEGTEVTANMAIVDARLEIENIIDFYDALASEQGVHVSCEGNEFVHADPILFQRAVSNILANALRYTPPDGRIWFEVKRIDSEQIQVSCSDTGIGIGADQLPKIFDRFFRVEPSRHVDVEGAGLGLAIVKSIMCLHGRSVTANSTLGLGTTIALSFQAATKSSIP